MSETLADWVTTFATRSGLLLYHDLSGRTCRLEGEEAQAHANGDWSPEVRARLRERGFLVPVGATIDGVILNMFPIRWRWASFVRVPGAPPLIAERHVGDQTWRARPLDALEGTVWLNATGQVSVGELLTSIEGHFGPDGRQRARATLLQWLHGHCQLVKLIDRPVDQLAAPPPHLFSLIHHHPLATDDQPDEPVDLHAYHKASIVDAADQFDQRETTLSHLLRVPSPVLGGRSFGEALIETLAPPPGARCLEVGGGTGWLAQRVLETRGDLAYTIVDLSPTLSQAQSERLKAAGLSAHTQVGNAYDLPVPAKSVDLLINNEVVADLEATLIDPAAPPTLLRDLDIVPRSPRVMNVGALTFLQEVHRVLKPGGRAYLMEYGALHEEPVEARHLDHPEVGIEWGVMAKAAENLGFAEVEVTDIGQLLSLTDAPVLCLPPESFNALNALVIHLGGTALEKRALTPHELTDRLPGPLEAFQPLHFEPACERVMSFRPARMMALLLTK